jgi:Heparinase II/III-like protein
MSMLWRSAVTPVVLLAVVVWFLDWQVAGAFHADAQDALARCTRVHEVRQNVAALDRSGARPGTVNLSLNPELLKLAKCYARSGDREAADVVVEGLLKYAEVVRSWPVLDRDGKPQSRVDQTYWDLRGFWGGQWVFTDLRPSGDLARSFELIAGSGALANSDRKHGHDSATIIKEQLLRYLVDFNLKFGRGGRVGSLPEVAVFPFHNMDPARLEELVVFGRTVDPAYIHIATRFLRAFPTVGFFRDGFWHEGSISYHRQVIEALDSVIAALQGYSDPAGYDHKGYVTIFGDRYDGVLGRFDNLDPLGDRRNIYARARAAEHPFTFPDQRMLAKNDTHATDRGSAAHAPQRSKCLLGLRHCILVQGVGAARNILHLDFGGTDGHEHLDALHFDYWAGGRLMVSDGNYLGTSPRAFNMSTAAHNTVVVNGTDQNNRFANRRALTPADAVAGLGFSLWQGYGQGDTNNQGDLQAAGLTNGKVVYVRADAARAYAGATTIERYERSLALIKGDGLESYVLDVFRIAGGHTHEWMLHGDLANTYELVTKSEENKPVTSRGPFNIVRSATLREGTWISDFDFGKGQLLRSHHVQMAKGELNVARAPAQVRPGDAPYLMVRQAGRHGLFVKIHAAEGARPVVRSVRAIAPARTPDAPVRLRVTLASGRVDLLTLRAGWQAKEAESGSLLVQEARTSSGRCLWKYEGDVETPTRSWRTVSILGVSRRAAGDAANGFRLAFRPEDFPIAPEILHVRLPNSVVESFVVARVIPSTGGEMFVETEDDPGLTIEPDTPSGAQHSWRVKQIFYPSAGLAGSVSIRTTTNRMSDCKR